MIQERDAGLAPDDGSFVERVPPGYSVRLLRIEMAPS